jgi:CRISPR system Cascade subunit CasD
MDVLFLRLEGPLQSWGDNARWTVRDTRLEPTKSGVIGLIACASGWGLDLEGDRRSAALARGLLMAVREDRRGEEVRDYHTILGPLPKAEGGFSYKPAEISVRTYLADACFLVALAGDPADLDHIQTVLSQPVWPPFLGRRSCPLALPLIPALPGSPSRGRFAQIEQAIATFPPLSDARPASSGFRTVVELPSLAGRRADLPLQVRRDVPLSFSRRQFGQRYVYETQVHVNGG